jgi:hypothetical protein
VCVLPSPLTPSTRALPLVWRPFAPVQLDSDEYIAGVKTLDPLLMQGLGKEAASLKALRPYLPRYKGMQHPPPKTGDAQVSGRVCRRAGRPECMSSPSGVCWLP